MKINESTVRSFKKHYRMELKEKCAQAELEEEDGPTVSELHLKKRGRKLLLGDKLDLMVQRYIADTRKVGGAVSTAIVRAGAARGFPLTSQLSHF